MRKSKLIGKIVRIISKDSIFYGGWGTIKAYDGEYYHIAMFNGTDSLPIFSRNEFEVEKEIL